MNIPNLTRVRDFLATLDPRRFDMTHWSRGPDGAAVATQDLLHDCGTAGCIGGWTEALFHTRAAREVLDLTQEQGLGLFYDFPIDRDVTRDQAVQVLTHLIETGEVQWAST